MQLKNPSIASAVADWVCSYAQIITAKRVMPVPNKEID
jgi:hypothetical protein